MALVPVVRYMSSAMRCRTDLRVSLVVAASEAAAELDKLDFVDKTAEV